MRRHTPSLYPHPEQDSLESTSLRQHTYSNSADSLSRAKGRSHTGGHSHHPHHTRRGHAAPKYADLYTQFVQRYRSSDDSGVDDDPRNDPDSHYFQHGLGQLVDTGDSDREDDGRELHARDDDGRPSIFGADASAIRPTTHEEEERLEWQIHLASVLAGEVLKSEKRRITVELASSAVEQNNVLNNIWLEIRARIHGRSLEAERQRLEERRTHIVDPLIDEINNFRVPDGDSDVDSVLTQVNAIIRRLEVAQFLYPNLKALHLDRPKTAESKFMARWDTLNTWSTVLTSLRRQVETLRTWTGSDTLDVSQPNTTAEEPIGEHPPSEHADGTSFVERLLKEESMQRTFEKGALTTIHSFISAARDAQVNLAPLFEEMNLPKFDYELIPIISFPTKLVQAELRVRLDYVNKLTEPEVLIIDQITEDLRISIGLACMLKRQYESFLAPDPGGKWNLPQSISSDYDATILEALAAFFRLIHLKLKHPKGIYFKETDLLESQRATFDDVSMTVAGGSALVAEQLCGLTNKLMVRVTNYFETQVRVPSAGDHHRHHRHGRTAHDIQSTFQNHMEGNSTPGGTMSDEQMVSWYGKILDNVRLRYRKLQRYARVLTQRFSNSAEYTLEDVPLDQFIATLVATDHFLVYTQSFEEDGTYIIAPSRLRDEPETIRRLLTESFHVDELVGDDSHRVFNEEHNTYENDDYGVGYLLVLSPRSQFLWNGLVLMLDIPKIELDLKDNRVRLIADGPSRRLALAKQEFAEVFMPIDEDGEPLEMELDPLVCVAEQQAHLPAVNRELRKISRATNRLAESIVDSVHHVRNSLRMATGCQELLGNWYLFASEHGQHAQKYMDRVSLLKFHRLLIRLAISWVTFVCDDCDPTDQRTFRWAVNALEFTHDRTKRDAILHLPAEQYELLRQRVGVCMALLVHHFDILGARSTVEARREKEKQEDSLRRAASDDRQDEEDDFWTNDATGCPDSRPPFTDASTRMFSSRIARSIALLEEERVVLGKQLRTQGRVLDDRKPEDRSLVFLASSSSNISVRWQQGRFIGAGAFGSVYLAVNLDSGTLMAVKEIKFQELSGLPNLYAQIKDELSVMERLKHPNVVEYYGIEVHRDKVYIFEEYCQGGSLASLIEHGPVEDDRILQLYTMQMLQGVAYLHSEGIVHRDVKPDNILLDHMGVIKIVDFGAAKVLAKQKTMQRSRRPTLDAGPPPAATGAGLHNSLTGTPMYMSPEVIKNGPRGRQGAMDIWSLGCVVLELATGRKPWSNLDNEWAIMFHIGVATQHPPLPEPGQMSALGVSFIRECLTIDPFRRPSAIELLSHPWMVQINDLLNAAAETDSPTDSAADESGFEGAAGAHQAAKRRDGHHAHRGSSPETPIKTYTDFS